MHDCATTEKDARICCMLNLATPMLSIPHKLNLTKAHLVFQASAFKDGKDGLDKEEVYKWEKRVIFFCSKRIPG